MTLHEEQAALPLDNLDGDADATSARTVSEILRQLRRLSISESDKGNRFERLIRSFLRLDPQWADQFSNVWLWTEWPGNGGRHDTGIDLVAEDRISGDLVAIQCKFYAPSTTISKDDIDTFLSESGKQGWTQRIVVSTTDKWTSHAEEALKGQQVPVRRLGLSDLGNSAIDWSRINLDAPDDLVLLKKKKPRDHQREALADVKAGFESSERGKMIMACGTGKTFTSLRLAEDLVGAGGSVLFLVPSISLLSQALREWTTEASVDLNPMAVCSDPRVSRKFGSGEDISIVDLALPATTSLEVVSTRLQNAVADDTRMTVVFATYQSIDVVAQAQAAGGLKPFDLVLCDEAHRTTGVTLAGDSETAFVKVHDDDYLRAHRRLYMTATPRIYEDAAKAKAGDADAVLASMDDEAVYGPEFHRLSFGEAVSRGLLSDYKVLVLAVDEESVARTFQEQFKDQNNELQLDDYAKIIGCWNGLAKRGLTEHTFDGDTAPMRRAVAFAGNIAASKTIEQTFPAVIEQYIEAHDLDDSTDDADPVERVLRTEVRHVDGGMNALIRNEKIDWLKEGGDEATCRILTNARCLSEGVDVPALDAVLFLSPRRSVVDVVQSVGRVMRKTDEKKYGYIILPVGIPAGMEPEDALRDNDRYRVVWDVLQALRAHDERFDAYVNQIELNKSRTSKINVIGIRDSFDTDGNGEKVPDQRDPVQDALPLAWPALDSWREALYARIVKKVGSRRYWETWASDIAKIAQTHITRINALLSSESTGVREHFDEFLEGLRGNLNDSISQGDAVDMLAQHLITRPVFDALFEGYAFTEHNPVAQAMQRMLDVLDEHQLDDENSSLAKFYDSVRDRAKGIDNAEGRQRIIVELYDTFFKTAFPRTVDKLGIVYTPLEVVDFILNSADWALRKEFGFGMTDNGVHVLDGFTGTGTFMVRLLQSGLIKPEDLARKYASELHANEFLLLAYYIAAVNIETAYHDLSREQDPDVGYLPFPGLVLTDTFQSYEDGDAHDRLVLPVNDDRITRQLDLDIRVLLGNPPYSSGQDSANDNNANEKYPQLDAQIRQTYDARSEAQHKASLYDSYIRAIKWASLRLADRGVVAFVTNGGWLDSLSADGMRKSLVEEFSSIYVFNLRGNQRTSGAESKREGGKIFDAGSRATVAIFLLIKNPDHVGPGSIYYRDIGDYLSREEKLRLIADAGSMEHLELQTLVPNLAGDWLNQRSDDFAEQVALSRDDDPAGGIFRISTGCPLTSRDAWTYNFSRAAVRANMEATISYFNSLIELRAQERARSKAENDVAFDRSFYSLPQVKDETRISWDEKNKKDLAKSRPSAFKADSLRVAAYRPFMKQHMYLNRTWNNSVYRIEELFPTPAHPNIGFYCVGKTSTIPFSVLMTDHVPDRHLTGAGSGGQFFARYRYEPEDTGRLATTVAADAPIIDGYRQLDNITDEAHKRFTDAYGSEFTKDDVFYYLYGLLHSRDYRDRYAADLKKLLPRAPLAVDPAPFVEAGRTLADLHVNYESAELYALGGLDDVLAGTSVDAAHEQYRVTKLRYGKPTPEQKRAGLKVDRSVIIFNSRISVTGIPAAAHEYLVGSKTPLDWIIERFQDKVHTASGIRNDPNDWARATGNPKYILELIARLVTVSVRTVQVVDSLPELTVLE